MVIGSAIDEFVLENNFKNNCEQIIYKHVSGRGETKIRKKGKLLFSMKFVIVARNIG